MAELKTLENDADVRTFLENVENATRRQDALQLLDIFERATGEKPRMWGKSIVGYGKYHYKSERSTQEGDWPLTAFSPRKQNTTVYIMPGFDNYGEYLEKLGKHKTSVSCLYINKLADVDLSVLEQLIKRGYQDMKKAHST